VWVDKTKDSMIDLLWLYEQCELKEFLTDDMTRFADYMKRLLAEEKKDVLDHTKMAKRLYSVVVSGMRRLITKCSSFDDFKRVFAVEWPLMLVKYSTYGDAVDSLIKMTLSSMGNMLRDSREKCGYYEFMESV